MGNRMGNKSLDSLHDVLRRTIERKPITMHWKNGGKLGCQITVGDAEVASMHCDAHHYLTLKDSYCSGCAEAARQALDQSEAMKQVTTPGLQEIMDGMSVCTAGQPTEWLDITACGGGLCVAWNSDRYLLTDAQARKLRDALSALLSEVKD